MGQGKSSSLLKAKDDERRAQAGECSTSTDYSARKMNKLANEKETMLSDRQEKKKKLLAERENADLTVMVDSRKTKSKSRQRSKSEQRH